MSDKQPIPVICAANEAYAMPMAVMLTSLVCNLKSNRDVDIYIIESGIPLALQQKIEVSILQNKKGSYRLDIHWFKLDMSVIKDLPVRGHVVHITSEAYARFLAPDLLPASYKRAVYLDSDLVVLADIALLYDAMDDQHIIAAVANVFLPYVSSLYFHSTKAVVFDYAERGIPPTNRYFGSGVLVINLDLWRERKITPRILEYLEDNKEEVFYHDQGGLNAILHDQWLRLDQRWNQTTTALYPQRWQSPGYTREDWRQTKNDPFIVHYTGIDKPWNPGFARPRASYFYRYYKKTLFKNELKISRVEYIIGFRAYYRLWKAKNWLRALVSERKSQDSP